MNAADTPQRDGYELLQVALTGLLRDDEVGLLRAASDLGCELALVGLDGCVIVGDEPPQVVLSNITSGAPQLVKCEGDEYLGAVYFHDGDELCKIVCRLSGGEPGRARSLRSAHYLIRLSETLLQSAVRRELATRLHHLQVEESHLELQLKSQRLDQAVARMKDSERIKTSFLATVSHELRTLSLIHI